MTLESDLILHIMYEHQYKAGKASLNDAEIRMHLSDELFDHQGNMVEAIAAIRQRVGLAPREIVYEDN